MRGHGSWADPCNFQLLEDSKPANETSQRRRRSSAMGVMGGFQSLSASEWRRKSLWFVFHSQHPPARNAQSLACCTAAHSWGHHGPALLHLSRCQSRITGRSITPSTKSVAHCHPALFLFSKSHVQSGWSGLTASLV